MGLNRASGRPQSVDRLGARAAANEQDAAILLTAAFTGLRLGELRALRWRDVSFAKRVREARDRTGLEPLRCHDLRDTFGTLAVRVFPLTDVKALMGHADIQTTMLYAHHVPQHDAADKLSAALSAKVSAGPGFSVQRARPAGRRS